MSVLHLAREELLQRQGYRAAASRFDLVRLHANEMARWDDTQAHGWNRYPPARPTAVSKRLAEVLEVSESRLLITRGSNEGIDLLVRAFCRDGVDSIVACAPTFGMYRICAEVQNAGYLEIPLDRDFDIDAAALAGIDASVKLLFLCSPGNPSGRLLATARLREVCNALTNRAVVVLDQAYAEFSDDASMLELLSEHDNLVILRTFSKAWGLAGLRCGIVIANPELIGLLESLLPPYAIPTPTIQGVLEALEPGNLATIKSRIENVKKQKSALQAHLERCPHVTSVYRSHANFVLVRFCNPQQVYEHLINHRILVRKFDHLAGADSCLRITVGNPQENEKFRQALETLSA